MVLPRRARCQAGVASSPFSFAPPILFPLGLLTCLMAGENKTGDPDVIELLNPSTGTTIDGVWWHGGSGYTATAALDFIAFGF